jgi:hypothetical protein
MTNDKPPVAPIEGFYAMLRNGEVVSNIEKSDIQGYFCCHFGHEIYEWKPDGTSFGMTSNFDIIATISPDVMARAVAMSGEDQGPLTKASALDPMPVGGDYTLMPTKLAEALNALVPLADAVLDHADAHCRAFPIATAPTDRRVSFWNSAYEIWEQFKCDNLKYLPSRYTHWAEPLPLPTTPTLPAVFTELGQALERLKANG